MHADERPDPDAVLAKVSAAEPPPGRGRLKIFFGYAAGVGKTYAMLAAARELEMKRGDVLVGYVEPHGRPETEALLLGLDIVPYRTFDHRGVALREFDVDEAIRRRPKLVLVDELAHTNAEGSRHRKRWQDVQDLLDAGVDVYSTLNVQHVESLNDVVGKVSGVVARETVPDAVFDEADEIVLIDLPPEELLERFREGKVYLPDQAARAADRFFKRETLVALRELALRKTAEHVNRKVELGRRGLAARPIWATRERVLVAVGPSPSSARLVRAARRMATELRCPWFAVAVEPESSTGARAVGLEHNLRVAERLGAEVVTLHADRVAPALVRFAHDRGVTRIVVGKTAQPWWRLALRGSIVDAIVRRSGDIDVLVIRGDDELGAPAGARRKAVAATVRRALRDFAVAALSLAVAVLVGLLLRRSSELNENIALVFVLAVACVAYTAGPAPTVVAAAGAVLAFNFFFVEPVHTFTVNDPAYLVTFGVLLVIGLLISGLVQRVRAQAASARTRADANEALYRVSRQLGGALGGAQIAADLERLLRELLAVESTVWLPGRGGSLGPAIGAVAPSGEPRERAVAEWVHEHAREAGAGTDTLPHAACWHLPLASRGGETFGVLSVAPRGGALDSERTRLLRSIAAIAAQALEREALEARAARATLDAESERMRSDLLSTVSHDLRTPLAAVSGGASAVLHSSTSTLSPDDRAILADIESEAERLIRLVENLLYLGRLDDGRATPRSDWRPVEEIFDAALRQAARASDASRIRIELPGEPLLCWADEAIITQAVANLLDNAAKYAPAGEIVLSGSKSRDGVRIAVADSGPGFPGGQAGALLERFRRGEGAETRGVRGSGLGLAICRAAALAHGGAIRAENRPEGGAVAELLLPDPADVPRPDAATVQQ